MEAAHGPDPEEAALCVCERVCVCGQGTHLFMRGVCTCARCEGTWVYVCACVLCAHVHVCAVCGVSLWVFVWPYVLLAGVPLCSS